uniref:Transmembrane protein 186 n=1 Tax=Diabrotica virgifera virgifera TaxID=50390 RepID=A0A6P7G718_DIAVI
MFKLLKTLQTFKPTISKEISTACLISSNISNNRLINQNVRLFSSDQNNTQSSKSNFNTVYRLPFIKYFSVINRVKFYQTVLTGITIPTSFALNLMNLISTETFQVISIIGLTGCISLYGAGHVTSKFIGFIYYDEERDVAKIAYVDFWGWRKDVEMPVSDIVPSEDIPFSVTNKLYMKFKRYSTPEVLKYNLRLGIIYDGEQLKKVL